MTKPKAGIFFLRLVWPMDAIPEKKPESRWEQFIVQEASCTNGRQDRLVTSEASENAAGFSFRAVYL
jgi:hypothetical protein